LSFKRPRAAQRSGRKCWALKAGKQAPAKLPQAFSCRINLHGTFADGQTMEASDFDVCSQKTINLTD
jgi:hypothetical protein